MTVVGLVLDWPTFTLANGFAPGRYGMNQLDELVSNLLLSTQSALSGFLDILTGIWCQKFTIGFRFGG